MPQLSTMEKPSPQPPERDQICAALEACAGALRALEVASTRIRAGDNEARRVTRALGLLREAIAELRSLQAAGANLYGSGFVLPVRPTCRPEHS